MAQSFTSNTLIESIKRRAQIPEAQNTFTSADFLDLANEEMKIGLVPSIMRLHEDHLLRTDTIALVSGQSNYAIPYRAIGNRLRELSYVDTNGSIYEMTRINIEDLPDYEGAYTTYGINDLLYYYVRGNEVILVPSITGTVTGSLAMSYYLQPNELVAENRAATITDINRTTGVITVSSIPTVFSGTSEMDFITTKPPHSTLGFDITPSAIDTTANTITFATSDIPSQLVVNDYINLAGEAIVPQVPAELHVVLAHRTALRCMEAMGDAQGVQVGNQKLAEMEQTTTTIIDNRVEGSPRKVVNRHGFLRQGRYRRN